VCGWDPIEVADEAFYDMDGHYGGVGTVGMEFEDWNISGLNVATTDNCQAMWCVYVPQGTYGVGGASVGMVYMYRNSPRPAGPPYAGSTLVAGFELDSSSTYGASWPKTIPITDRGTGSGVYGSVKWYGGVGHGTLAPGCSAYRLQIPFKLRGEESSSSSRSSASSQSSRSSASSSSSQSACGQAFHCTNGSILMPALGLSDMCTLFPGGFNITAPLTKSSCPGCVVNGEAYIVVTGASPLPKTYSLFVALYIGSTFVMSASQPYCTVAAGTLTLTWTFTSGWVPITATANALPALGVPYGAACGQLYLSVPSSLAGYFLSTMKIGTFSLNTGYYY